MTIDKDTRSEAQAATAVAVQRDGLRDARHQIPVAAGRSTDRPAAVVRQAPRRNCWKNCHMMLLALISWVTTPLPLSIGLSGQVCPPLETV